MSRKFAILKVSISIALLIWFANFFVLIVFWSQLPRLVIGLISLYQFAIASDARIFKIPFASESEFDVMSREIAVQKSSEAISGNQAGKHDKQA
jgi:hypothetical protein